MKKDILILSFYYPPDLSACAFRISALVKAIEKKWPSKISVDILTTIPNRYHSFVAKAPSLEKGDRIFIKRFSLPEHKGRFLDQSYAFAHFAKQVIFHTRNKKYDLIFATSSRLMTAALAAHIAQSQKTQLYLDIRDILTDTMNDLLKFPAKYIILPILKAIEKRTMLQANVINLVSPGFGNYFSKKYPRKRLNFFTNGIDEEFIDSINNINNISTDSEEQLTIVYAGNIGEGQGLHSIIPKLAKYLVDFQFKIIGDGGTKDELLYRIKRENIHNVKILPPMPRQELLKHYKSADILFLHLNDYQAFQKVLPSKIFEYGALGKPILAGVAGYAAEFIKKEIKNAQVFSPCNAEDAIRCFKKLKLGDSKRDISFIEKFRRDRIMSQMAEDILLTIQEK